MGCVFSRPEFDNPRIFQVWNVDSEGRHVKPGRIEVTESQLILYQKGDIVVKWPLRSLRRYGFDAELFSFECGRRCPTGPGVYAFKCRRAEVLFNILQECIQNSGGGGGGGAGTVGAPPPPLDDLATALHSPPPVPNGTLPPPHPEAPDNVDAAGYLEPITVNGGSSARGSPGGYICIHGEVPGCCSLGGGRTLNHHYVNNEVIEQSAPPPCSNGLCVVHHYANAPATAESAYVNGPVVCCVDLNTNYAKLDDLLKQEQTAKRHKEQQHHFYVNVKPEPNRDSGRTSPTLLSPTSPGSHCYANLVSPSSSVLGLDPAPGTIQVNYAVLDLDQNECGAVAAKDAVASPSSAPNSANSLANSPTRSPEGYAQIDFDKTVALSNSANPCPFNDDSIRKTRHNAVIPCTSMSA